MSLWCYSQQDVYILNDFYLIRSDSIVALNDCTCPSAIFQGVTESEFVALKHHFAITWSRVYLFIYLLYTELLHTISEVKRTVYLFIQVTLCLPAYDLIIIPGMNEKWIHHYNHWSFIHPNFYLKCDKQIQILHH